MKRLSPSLPAVVLFIVLTLSSCAMLSPGADGGLTADQARAGLVWLDATLAKFETTVAAAKAIAPEKADAIDAAVGDNLTALRAGLVAIREQVAAGQAGAADAVWRAVRPIVGRVALKLLPYGIDAVTGG